MKNIFPHWLNPKLALLLVACLFIFSGISSFELRESTEPREAGIAADMLQNSQFLVPALNGRTFLEKPPLSYWLGAASMAVFGYTPFAARLPSALAGLATILLFAFFFRNSERKEWLIFGAGCFLISMVFFWENARTAGQDALLAFGIALALLSFFVAKQNDSRTLWILFAVGIAVSTMTKGVIGLAIPGIVIFSYLIAESSLLTREFNLSDWLRPALWTMAGLLPIFVWLVLLFNSQGIDSVKEVVWANSLGRFQGEYAQGSHNEPWYYYIKLLPQLFMPWSLILYCGIWKFRSEIIQNRRTLFFLCWIIAPFILLSLSSGKRPSYLLMIYPAAAALLAEIIADYVIEFKGASLIKAFKGIGAFYATILPLFGLYLIHRLFLVTGQAIPAIVALVSAPVVFSLWRSVVKLRVFEFFCYSYVLLFIFYVAYFNYIVPELDSKKSAQMVMQPLVKFESEGYSVMLYSPSERMEGAASFYIQHRVPVIKSSEQLNTLLSDNKKIVVLVSGEDGIDISRYYDRAQVGYGKDRYHYVSAPMRQ